MELCTRCRSNPAMVYIMRQDASGVHNEGLCLPCAKELGIKLPTDDYVNFNGYVLANVGSIPEDGSKFELDTDILHIEVSDKGRGIDNIDKAMEPLYTTRPELERSGMGFAFMEAFMDDLEVESTPGQGTTVRMKKKMTAGPWFEGEEQML